MESYGCYDSYSSYGGYSGYGGYSSYGVYSFSVRRGADAVYLILQRLFRNGVEGTLLVYTHNCYRKGRGVRVDLVQFCRGVCGVVQEGECLEERTNVEGRQMEEVEWNFSFLSGVVLSVSVCM